MRVPEVKMAGVDFSHSALDRSSGISRLAAHRLGGSAPIVLDVENVFAISGEKEVENLFRRSQPVKNPPGKMQGQLFLKLPEEREASPKGCFPFRR